MSHPQTERRAQKTVPKEAAVTPSPEQEDAAIASLAAPAS
jgi:hypothetical protein